MVLYGYAGVERFRIDITITTFTANRPLPGSIDVDKFITASLPRQSEYYLQSHN
jgi:hypothetical protein